jgi:hypothetical protein
MAGAYVAALVVFLNYQLAFEHYTGGKLLTPPAAHATA